MRHRILVALLAVSLLLLSACGDDDGADPTTEEPTSAAPTEGEPTSSGSPTSPEGPSGPITTWPTDDVSVPFTGAGPSVPILVDIRVGSHPSEGFDRVVLEFDILPGYDIGYQSEIVYDGSGEPVDLPGTAFIQLVFNPAQAHDDNGESTLDDPPIDPVDVDFAALDAYVLNGDYEGYVSVALGLTDEVGFQVDHFRKDNGNHVVHIDLARP